GTAEHAPVLLATRLLLPGHQEGGGPRPQAHLARAPHSRLAGGLRRAGADVASRGGSGLLPDPLPTSRRPGARAGPARAAALRRDGHSPMPLSAVRSTEGGDP